MSILALSLYIAEPSYKSRMQHTTTTPGAFRSYTNRVVLVGAAAVSNQPYAALLLGYISPRYNQFGFYPSYASVT